MAYLSPKVLSYPNCDYTTKVEIVVSLGPHSKKGDIPSRSHQHRDTGVDGPTITCPNDGTVLCTDTPRKRA
ncbi:MAG: hypothetical protein QNK92_07875 [Amylibacter sp.]